MTLAKHLLVPLLFSLGSSAAAQGLSHPMMASHSDALVSPRPFIATADTIDLLAAMVQFQIDNDNRTSGNGQFDLSTPAAVGFDSPPRNRQYFEDHLTFLKNYYRKVSKGKTIIRTTLIDSVYTLASQMARYSPPKSGPNTQVADLARDTWQRVDSSGRVADFSRYDCFVIFHAGVGRDVDVAGTIGFDPTPLDIPSLYLGLNAFKSFYGQSYEGVPVRNGFKITNAIVMPETESRELPATPTNILLRLGINGLLCASVGNFLGLPDLFDTNTGRSGIGRFGLMDGQAIFSFAGLFPPEPSAWEKYWLGWIQPIAVQPRDTTTKFLPAVSMNDRPDRVDTVYRVPISGSEFYLVENRNRDWARNGQRVTSSYNNIIRTQTFARDTVGFNPDEDLSTRFSAITGVVTDVEDFDWSLPGGVGRNNEFFDGGILIWHIDENIIAQGLASNGVNANPNRRGVDLEEADGSQDIGQEYGQLEPGSGSEEGTALDFWYRGNSSPVFRNLFSSESFPSSASNAGANSHITLNSFSQRSERMTVRITLGANIELLKGFPKSLQNKIENISLTVGDIRGNIGHAIFVSTNAQPSSKPLRLVTSSSSRIFAWKVDGSGVLRADGAFAIAETPSSSFLNGVLLRDLDGDNTPEVITAESLVGIQTTYRVRAFFARQRPNDSLGIQFFSRTVNRQPTTALVAAETTLAVGASGGKIYFLKFDGTIADSVQSVGSGETRGISFLGNRSFCIVNSQGEIAARVPQLGVEPGIQRNLGKSIAGPASIGQVGDAHLVALGTSDGNLFVVTKNLQSVSGFPVSLEGGISQPPALADVDGDGYRDIIVFAGNKIYAYNYAGASLDNFPKLVIASKPIASNPVVADVDGDGDVDIVAVTADGVVAAIDKNGTMASGFPLQAGVGNQSVAAFAYQDGQLSVTNVGLAVASSDDGSVSAWKTAAVGGNRQPQIPWGQFQRDAQHSGLAIEQISGSPISSAFFPKDRAYNWPNPVYNGKTFIRYFVRENATVKIKIFDLAGDLVTEFNGPGTGGVDNEVEWNIGDVQSGVYLARIEASGGSNSDVAVVKVAVVK